MKKLALFDFDGTITSKDTFLEFIKFYKGVPTFWLGFLLLSPLIVAFKLKIIPNWKAKQWTLIFFFRNEKLIFFNTQCEKFCKTILPSLIRPQALEEIKKYQSESTPISIVSASPENWIKPWADQLAIPLIGTRLEIVDNKLTGKLESKNCYGIEKVNRIHQQYQLSSYHEIIAYGDSSGDKEMLAIAHRAHYKPFRK